MLTKADLAADLFNQGCNCAQAVLAAAAEDIGIDRQQALRLASSFGGGMGRLREVCGAMTGLFIAVGELYGYTDLEDKDAKTRHYQLIQDLAAKFRDQYGTIICRDLLLPEDAGTDPLPSDRTPEYYQKRPCAEYVRYAAGLLDQLMLDDHCKG
jgi:C_GCAxxG_C_C family probable redox protein